MRPTTLSGPLAIAAGMLAAPIRGWVVSAAASSGALAQVLAPARVEEQLKVAHWVLAKSTWPAMEMQQIAVTGMTNHSLGSVHVVLNCLSPALILIIKMMLMTIFFR